MSSLERAGKIVGKLIGMGERKREMGGDRKQKKCDRKTEDLSPHINFFLIRTLS